MKSLWLILLFAGLSSCTTHPHSEGREAYIEKIEKFSAGDKQFAGLYHQFEYRTTLLNRDVSKTIHERLEKYYAWDEQESAEKLRERMSELDNKTIFWMSFFTPERKNDNLANKVSIWKIYLKVGNSRYEGQVKKANKNFSEAKGLFPYHSRWATPYYVEFPVPTEQVTDQKLTMIVTGPLGRREVTFPETSDNSASPSYDYEQL